MFCISGRNRETEKSSPVFLKWHGPGVFIVTGTQKQHYELRLTCYLKITNVDVMIKKYGYMNYNIYRKVGEG